MLIPVFNKVDNTDTGLSSARKIMMITVFNKVDNADTCLQQGR